MALRMPFRPPAQNLRRGALFMVGSAASFAAMGAAIKIASHELSIATVVFFRNAVGLAVLLPWLLPRGRTGLATADLRGHIGRGLAGLGSMYFFFYAIARLRLADAVLLYQSTPLFLPLVERVWLGEPIARRLAGVLAVGFLGILLILRPGSDVFSPAALAGLASAVLAAVAQVGVRRLTRTEPAIRIVFYFGLIGSLVAAVPAAAAWTTPSQGLLGILLAIGVFATAGQLLLTRAYAHAPAAQVGPFLYAGPVIAGVLDWCLWGTLPDRLFVAGALVVVTSAVLALRGGSGSGEAAP
jgi:drug/metabolite transporter (DMT)-like permease